MSSNSLFSRTKAIVLASRSPERRAILNELGFDIVVAPVDFDETMISGENAEHLVARLAFGKALVCEEKGWIVAADTVVVHGDKILGKPVHLDEARKSLFHMSGERIKVVTGTALRSPRGKIKIRIDSAILRMCIWTEESLDAYLQTGLWENRAGSFSVGHSPCPVELILGELDVVRGINGQYILKCLNRKL